MNKQRRAALDALQNRYIALSLGNILESITEIRDELEDVRDAEEEAFNNLPESLQSGEKGQDMQDAIDAMNSAFDTFDNIVSAFEGDDPVSDLDTAKGQE